MGAQLAAESIPVVLASDSAALPTRALTAADVITAQLAGYSYSGFQPDPTSYPTTNNTPLSIDAVGRLETHSTITSDEGSFRDDFNGATLLTALTGTLSFTNGSTAVVGAGTSFTSQVSIGQWIKKTTDSETLYGQVETIGSDTSLILTNVYAGTTAAGVAAHVSNWATTTPATGSITVANSLVTLASGTASGAQCSLQRTGDYLPYTFKAYLAYSQRIANQQAFAGFSDVFATPNKQARIRFTGTTNTQVDFVTSSSSAAADTQVTTVTLPKGGVTSAQHLYKIDISGSQAALSIDGVVVVTHDLHVPEPYAGLNIFCGTLNSAVVASGNFVVDAVYFYNTDRVQIDNDYAGEPMPVVLTGKVPVTFDPGLVDAFGHMITAVRIPQILVPFYLEPPSSLLTTTLVGTGASAQGTGTATFSTGTGTTSQSKGVSLNTVVYSPGYELFADLTASFTTPTSAASFQRLGLYNTQDGFSFGYSGLTFGLWTRFNGADTFVPQTAWNTDTLSGNPNSQFTANGAPVVLVPTNINLYRIRFGWLGIAPVVFEVLAPDGTFVVVHTVRYPNSQTSVSLTNPNLPLTVDVSKTAADATNLVVTSGCWVAGTGSPNGTPYLGGVGSIAALNAAVVLPVQGHASLAFAISGTWVGTLSFQFSLDGVTWTNDLLLDDVAGGFVSSTVANKSYSVSAGAKKLFRVVATAWTSGSALVTYNGGLGPDVITSQALITDASNNGPVTVKPASTASVATDLALVTALSPNSPLPLASRATYSAATATFTPAANATDIFVIGGSASKTIKILRLIVSGTQTTAGNVGTFSLIKRSTANTAGTAVATTAVPHDSADAAATAVTQHYTANPTVGTVVGAVDARRVAIPAPASVANPPTILEYDALDPLVAKPITLRGTAQQLAVNLGGGALPAGSANYEVSVTWTEE